MFNKVRLTYKVSILNLALNFLFSNSCFSSQTFHRIPDEFESVGGHGLGFANSGSVATSGLAAIRTNPAMLSIERNYSIFGGYHWPSVGREYYQAGAVDGKTSHLAAGVIYTSSNSDYENYESHSNDSGRFNAYYDSPIKYRVAAALSQSFQNISIGIGGQYIEGYIPDENGFNLNDDKLLVKSSTLNFGLAGLLTKQIRFGVSLENVANKKVKDIAPSTFRAGLAFVALKGFATAHIDYLKRDRVFQEKFIPSNLMLNTSSVNTTIGVDKPEHLITGSASARAYDILRVLVGLGKDIGGSNRTLYSAGLALVHTNFTISYSFSQPYTTDSESHHAINFSSQIAI